MTNGEKIQQDFECEVCEPIIEDDIIHVIFADKPHSAIGFDWSWWNAEYKEPTTKNDLGVDAVSRQFMRELGATCIATRDKNNKLIALGALDELPSVTPQESILDKIRAELIQSIQNGTLKIESGNEELFRIIDKFRTEVEPQKSEDKE